MKSSSHWRVFDMAFEIFFATRMGPTAETAAGEAGMAEPEDGSDGSGGARPEGPGRRRRR